MNTSVSEQQLLGLLNLHLKNHTSFEEGMSFDKITALPNGKFDVRSNFTYSGRTTEENYPSGSIVYQEVFNDFLA